MQRKKTKFFTKLKYNPFLLSEIIIKRCEDARNLRPVILFSDDKLAKSFDKTSKTYITKIRREAYENGLNAGAFLFITPAVSQAAACDGTLITTSAENQEMVPGTLPTF